jgi:hypothetical protein
MRKSSGQISFENGWEVFKFSQDEFKNFDREKQLEALCAIGHLAPSTHNTQPWRFFINKDKFGIVLYLDRRFVLPISDVSGRQAVVSMGCLLQNILIAADFYGFKSIIKYFPLQSKQVLPYKDEKTRYVKIVQIFFENNFKPKIEIKALFEGIFSRKIMRAEFDPNIALPDVLQKKLTEACDSKFVRMLHVTNTLRRLALAEFQSQADGYVINSKKFAKELGEWLLPNESTAGLGMPGVGFGLKDDQAKRMHSGLIGDIPLEPEDGLRFALGGKTAIEKSPFIGLISVIKDSPEYWLQAGLALEKMLLILESEGFSAAIHAAIVEVGLVNRMFAASMGSSYKLAVLFRAGKVKDSSYLTRPHAPRQHLSEVLLEKEF